MSDFFPNYHHFISGCFGGIVGTLLSHPFDTLRIKTQMNNRSIMNNFKEIYKNHGLIGFYKGLPSPLLAISLEKSIVFGVYNTMNNNKMFNNKKVNTIVSGYTAGVAASLFVAPMEAIKMNQQHFPNYTLDKCINDLVRSRNLFKSLPPTLFREPPGFAIYFSVYNMLNDNLQYNTLLHKFVYGSIAGCISWIFIYPADVIKTRVQLDNTVGLIEHIKYAYNNNLFYRGFSLSIMRAIPLHGGAFFGYEYLKNKII